MADNDTGDKRTDPAVIVGGRELIIRPETEEEVSIALKQHGRRIVDAYKDAVWLIHHIIHKTPEAARPRQLRILADIWRHLTLEEQVYKTFEPFAELAGGAAREVMEMLGKQVTIHGEPLSPSKN